MPLVRVLGNVFLRAENVVKIQQVTEVTSDERVNITSVYGLNNEELLKVETKIAKADEYLLQRDAHVHQEIVQALRLERDAVDFTAP